jgi:hypothetical protein
MGKSGSDERLARGGSQRAAAENERGLFISAHWERFAREPSSNVMDRRKDPLLI